LKKKKITNKKQNKINNNNEAKQTKQIKTTNYKIKNKTKQTI
jgi:hypothetical protein